MITLTKGVWWTKTWNPWMGCTKISEGCANCYMFREQKRYGRNPKQLSRSKTKFHEPMKWKEPELVFVCSWSDFWYEKVDPNWRKAAWNVIKETPQHIYLIPTKRVELIRQGLPEDWEKEWNGAYNHVWLGCSVESPKYLYRIDALLTIPTRKYFLSAEPLLEPLDLTGRLATPEIIDYGYGGLEWVILGGESDYKKPREMKEEWVTPIQQLCEKLGIPFFFKQWGGSSKIAGVWGGNMLGGKTYHETPPLS